MCQTNKLLVFLNNIYGQTIATGNLVVKLKIHEVRDKKVYFTLYGLGDFFVIVLLTKDKLNCFQDIFYDEVWGLVATFHR